MALTPSQEAEVRQIGEVLGSIIGGLLLLSFKAWLLVLVLGWFGVTALNFWQACVVLYLVKLLIQTK